jgi:hypothetical protein
MQYQYQDGVVVVVVVVIEHDFFCLSTITQKKIMKDDHTFPLFACLFCSLDRWIGACSKQQTRSGSADPPFYSFIFDALILLFRETPLHHFKTLLSNFSK